MTCAFCQIVDVGPVWALRHGDEVVSFKPFGATSPGHRLFVPTRHVADAAEDPIVTGRCFEEAARWGAQRDEPFNLVVNNRRVAGQTIFHLHVHYVPRQIGDRLGYRWKPE